MKSLGDFKGLDLDCQALLSVFKGSGKAGLEQN